ncbi:MAG: N-6 DNA methylase [Bacteroidia bacterium]
MTDIVKFTVAFNRIARHKSQEAVFTDFLDMVICTLGAGRYEEEYLAIVKRYKRDEIDMFCELMAEMLIVMDNGGEGLVDCLGEFYQQYISNKNLQQFFSPQHICDFMSQITIDKNTIGKTIHDPACGSGRMLLAAAKVSRDNYFTGGDIDARCVKVCAINLCLNGLQGEVAHQNSLTTEHWGGYSIKHLQHLHLRVPVIIKLPPNEGVIYNNRLQKADKDRPPVQQPNVITVTQTKLNLE